MIEKLDIKNYENKQQLLWFGIINKLNELVDTVNRHENIIRQIGEWGSSKGECLWCENLTKVNLDDRMIGCTTLDIPESYNELHKVAKKGRLPYMQNKRLRKALGIAQSALVKLANDAYDMDEHIYIDKILNQIERITKGGDNE